MQLGPGQDVLAALPPQQGPLHHKSPQPSRTGLAGDAVLTPGRCSHSGQREERRTHRQLLCWGDAGKRCRTELPGESNKTGHPGPSRAALAKHLGTASAGPETVLSLDAVIQLQEFILRGKGQKEKQAAHKDGYCVPGHGGKGTQFIQQVAQGEEATLKTTERVPAMPRKCRTRAGERGTVPADSRTQALGGDLRDESGGRAEGKGGGRKHRRRPVSLSGQAHLSGKTETDPECQAPSHSRPYNVLAGSWPFTQSTSLATNGISNDNTCS